MLNWPDSLSLLHKTYVLFWVGSQWAQITFSNAKPLANVQKEKPIPIKQPNNSLPILNFHLIAISFDYEN